MKQWALFLVMVILTTLSCTATQPAAEQPPPVMAPEPVTQAPPAAEPSAVSQPESAAPVVQAAPEIAPEPTPEPSVPELSDVEPADVASGTEPVFTVSQEVFDTTKADIQQLVQDLNRIIRAQNYNAWLTYLSDDYRTRVNSKEFLADIIARYPVYRNRINNARDYFRNVIVPSRANDRVDDIEFISERRVTAYTVNSQGTRLRLYDLENIDGSWKLVLLED